MERTNIVLKHTWDGLGDNLAGSTLPEILDYNGYDVYMSTKQGFRNEEVRELIMMNPFIKGYKDEDNCLNIEEIFYRDYPMDLENKSYIARIEHMVFGQSFNETPKIYYTPKFLPEWADKTFVDFSAVTLGNTTPYELFKREVMKNNTNVVFNTTTLNIFNYIDIMFSCKKFICTMTGSNSLASAVRKNNTECYIMSSWIYFILQGGGYCFHYNNVNYIPIDDTFPELELQEPVTYKEIFVNNINNVEWYDLYMKVVVDIGANRGFFSLKAASCFAHQIYAYEPSKKGIEFINSNFKNYYSNYPIEVHHKAVTDRSGDIIKMSSNMVNPDATIFNDTGYDVETISFEDIINNIPYNDIVVKCDCEGSEYEIILNTPDYVFDKIKLFYIEIHMDMNPKYPSKEQANKVRERLQQLGYTQVHTLSYYYWNCDTDGNVIPESHKETAYIDKWVRQ